MAPVDPTTLALLAQHALGLIRADTVIGLGSGRAATAFVEALAERVRAGLRVRGVPASEETARLATELGIPLATLEDGPLDLTVDGADEVDPQLDLIKGYGGALVRERIVAAASRRQVILVDESKLVDRLGRHGRLPIEVVPFALPLCRERLRALAIDPLLRVVDGRPFISDNGNPIIDGGVAPIPDARALERTLRAIPGVVDTGLFLGTADTVLLAAGGTVRQLTRG
jgi:ribose 5-phosphate isomerase A